MKHHYLNNKEKVAKLFADERSNSSDNEVFFKALNQCLNAMIYNRGKGTIINREDRRREFNKTILQYPVIICNSFDNIYEVTIDADEPPKRKSNNFRLEVNYSYINSSKINIDEYFLIDIVNYENIEKYLKTLEFDAVTAAHFYHDN